MSEADPDLNLDFDEWFTRLQALTNEALVEDDWVTRWYDHFTPEEALEDGPEDEEDDDD